MALYEDLTLIDIIGPIEAAILKGELPQPKTDGKIHLKNAWHPKRHWIDVGYDQNRRCDVWHNIYFRYYRLIPIGCRNCWKVTVRPRTFKELMDISELQHRMGINSKAGLENREYTGNVGGYGAFWYSDLSGGLDGARELFDKVSKELDKITDLKPILKRGCTEMETNEPVPGFPRGFSPSSEWDKIAEESGWDKREKLLDDFFVKGDQVVEPITVFKTHCLLTWIRYAKDHGDPTVREFIDEEFIIKKPETYHQSGKHSAINFKSTWGNNGSDNNRPDKSDKVCTEEDRKISVIQ